MFIVFEGPDFSGKSTLLNLLYEDLKDKYKVEKTKEPGATPIGAEIKKILMNPEFTDMTKDCEVLLFAADRAQHCSYIKDLLDKETTVLCDRYLESSYVYQGYLKGNNPMVYSINHVATKGLKQDLTILVTCDPEEALKRRQASDRIELSMSKDDYIKIYDTYNELYEDGLADKEDWIVIDTTNKSIEESYNELLEKLKPYIINFISRE